MKTTLEKLCIAAAFWLLFSIHLSGATADDMSEEGLKPPAIDAKAAIVIEAESGRVLYSKNATERRAIASTTKIMTAIVALERGRLDDMVTVSRRAAGVAGSSINLKAGDRFTLRDLLYGLLMSSGNDAAVAIAEHIGGSVEDFVDIMNAKAVELGAADTSFATPHGLDAAGHYSTAYDLALITRYALKNPVFAEIVGTNTANISGRHLYNTNELLEIYRGADGVKTGYTGKAGRCLVATASRDGMRIISVVLGSPTRYKRAEGSMAILNFSFSNYSMHMLIKAGEPYRYLHVQKGAGGSISLRSDVTVELPLTNEEFVNLQTRVHVPGVLKAPVYAGMDVGYVEYLADGEVLARSSLKTWGDVRRKNYFDYMGEIIEKWCRMVHEGIFMDDLG